ncbi:unnamed protein product [Boreogadus saida]
MLEKHGEAALEGLKYWCKLGFPEMGSFSLKRLQDRKKNQPGTESVESVGIFNLNVTRDIDPDLDCTGGPRANPPSPPPYDNAHEAASSDNLYPGLEEEVCPPKEEEKAPACSARPATRSQGNAPQSSQRATATPTKREPVASRLKNQGMAFSPTPQHGDVMIGQFPMIEVLNPQDGSPAYVFRAWRPSDIKDIAEWLPDPAAVGGAAFATALQELVQQHKASISEVRQLCSYRLTLRWGRIQGDMPGRDEADLMYNWDQGSVYRRLVEGLCERARGAFPMVRDWTAIRKIKQVEGETVADLMDRVEKVFKIHGGVPVPTDRVVQTPYEENLTAAFLDALADNISEFIETHCIEAEVKGGIRIDGTQEQLQVQGGARPVAQSSANTPRHDSSTSDFMKLQTMGGPPEELWNGLLDDTKRQSSRTNSTRVVASMVPV